MKTLYLLTIALACSLTIYAQDAPTQKKGTPLSAPQRSIVIEPQNQTPFPQKTSKTEENNKKFIIPSNETPKKITKSEFATLPKEKQEFILKNSDKYNLED